MKMELLVSAPCDGKVVRIQCQQGRPVGPGDALLWLDAV
ncbi:biotin/lipoyl-containing protein [Cedecea davisae]